MKLRRRFVREKCNGWVALSRSRLWRHYRVGAAVLIFLLLPLRTAMPYSQFQQYSQEHSGRNADCAMCHANPEGPVGIRPGQIGSLTPEGKRLYEQEQEALDPGQDVHSPILNDFGNRIIGTLGRVAVMDLADHPEKFADALKFAGDLDGDGIPDAREYLDGTNPVDAQSGAPWRLFCVNVWRSRFHIFMTLLVTISGIYGLNHLFTWFSRVVEAAREQRKADPTIDERRRQSLQEAEK